MRVPYSYDGLDPVVIVALEELQHLLKEMDRHGILFMWGAQPDLLNQNARSATIWAFQHLRRLERGCEPHLVERWALSNGWRNGPALLLRDYATAVNAGARFHTGPDPFRDSSRWLELATKDTGEPKAD